MNGGPVFKFTEAISLVVNCETQTEVDHVWERLSAGGQQVQCGWLKDRFGVSWRVVPTVLTEMLPDKEAERSKRVTPTRGPSRMDQGPIGAPDHLR